MIQINHVSKRFNQIQALDDVTLTLEPGKIIGLCGPNGAGKTTLIKILTGLIKDYQGSVTILDHPVSAYTKAKVAYLPDTIFLEEQMTAKKAKEFFSDMFDDFDLNRFDELMNHLQLDYNQPIASYSKGLKDKLQLALVLARNAEIYILDEPIAGVDPAARDLILQTIIKNYNPSACMIIATHLINDVEQLFDQVIFLKQGKIHTFDDSETIRINHQCSIEQYFKEVFKHD